MKKETINIQLDKDIVNTTKAILKENNLAIDDAVKMLYSQFVLTRQLPFKIGKGKN